MRLRILSDVHLEFEEWAPPPAKADVTIIAGDLHKGTRGLPWIESHFAGQPVVYIAGNHEFYGEHVESVLADLGTATRSGPIHFLENRAVEIGDVTFLGCTLWTDFNLHQDPETAGQHAGLFMNDYRTIRAGPEQRRLRSSDTALYHARSRRWLEAELEARAGRKLVVVTHHAPSKRSLDEWAAGDLLGAAYASPLDELVAASGAALWVHGHTHHSEDYALGRTRVLANQHGYPEQLGTRFRPGLVVEV